MNIKSLYKRFLLMLIPLFFACNNPGSKEAVQPRSSNSYTDLVALYHAWRAFENPPRLNGAPD